MDKKDKSSRNLLCVKDFEHFLIVSFCTETVGLPMDCEQFECFEC